MIEADVLAPPTRSTTGSLTDRIARWTTELFAPAVLAATMPVIVAFHASPTVLAGAGWSMATVLFTAIVPYGIIWFGVRRGQLTDHHIGVREQRRRPLLFALGSVLTGLAILIIAGAPRELTAMVVVMLAVLGGIFLVNRTWKLSAHAAVSTGSVAVLTILFGPLALAAAVLVIAIAWSRVHLADHTWAQVMAGAALGAVIAAPVFVLVR